MFKLLRTLFRDVPGAIVDQPHCTRGESKCMVKRMAREEDLADVVVAREETLGTLDKEPLVEPPASVGAFRVDCVLVGDTQDVPNSRDLGVVALLVETSMHHLEPEFPRARVIVAQLRGAMHDLVQRESAPEVSDLVQSLEADLKFVRRVWWASSLLEHTVDEVDVNRARQYHEDVIVMVSNRVALTMQVRVRITRAITHGAELSGDEA